MDGVASQTYAAATNRITTTGHEYDNAGNQIRGKAPDGTIQRFEFDEAGRIVKIKTDAGADIETNTYGTSRERLLTDNGSLRTYYAWGGSSVLCEYTETGAGVVPNWAKSYIYAGDSLLSTITKSGSSEVTEFQHPDGLGTRLITDTALNTAKEQNTLPFGTLIDAETDASSNQRFTSYDRSSATGLDYAVNRTYNSGQSRFTQVDPIDVESMDIGNPQSMNMYAYVQNNPVDFVDPSGLLIEIPGYCPPEFQSCGGGGGGGDYWGWGFYFSSGGGGGGAIDDEPPLPDVPATQSGNSGARISNGARSVITRISKVLNTLGLFGNVPFNTPSWNPNLPDALSTILSGGLNHSLVIRNYDGSYDCGGPGQEPCFDPEILYIDAIPAYPSKIAALLRSGRRKYEGSGNELITRKWIVENIFATSISIFSMPVGSSSIAGAGVVIKGTGRNVARNLAEKHTMESIMANPRMGKVIIKSLSDPRFKGWTELAPFFRTVC